MNKKLRVNLIRICVALALFIPLFVLEHMTEFSALSWYIRMCIFAVPYLIAGYDVIARAARNIAHGKVFDENFLMMIATFGAFGVGEYSEAVAVMIFYQVGELFQSYAVGKSRQSIQAMMEICPEYVNIEQDGEIVKTDPDEVETGTLITVFPGERIPIDGVVEDGESSVDTSALTGESVPVSIKSGDEALSGCVNGSGKLLIRTTKEFEDSTVSRILELVENASAKKAKTENFITRFAKYYTPVVTIAAVLLAVLPPLFVGDWLTWLERACVFLVISCPCALVISVPLGFFGGIGAASRAGILVKGSNYLELSAEINTIVFDKTGTLTKGKFAVTDIFPEKGVGEEELLGAAAEAERYSNHPIAISVREAWEKYMSDHGINKKDADSGAYSGEMGEKQEENGVETGSSVKEIPGRGVCVTADGHVIFAGNYALMEENGISADKKDGIGSDVYVAKDGAFLGMIRIADELKDKIGEKLAQMRRSGAKKLVMLTGDREEIAAKIAGELGLDKYYAGLLPADKVARLEELMADKGSGKLAFVGDGINDAPVLARADVGFAMGGLGSDAAIEAADIVIMDDDPGKISTVAEIAGKTCRIVKENIVFALGVKFAVLILGAIGIANMWGAVFADVGVAVIAILNSMRMLRFGK